MKTVMTIAASVMISGVLFAGAAKAGLWEKLSSFTWGTVESKSFSIEASGWNLRGYMFRIPQAAGVKKECLFVAGEQKGGLTCWEIEE